MNDRGPYWKNRVAELKRVHKCERCGTKMNPAETRACCGECRRIQCDKQKANRAACRTLSTKSKTGAMGFVVL